MFPPHFVYDFPRKMFHIMYYINWPNFIVWLPLILEILCTMRIAIISYPGCDNINLESKFIFLIKLTFYLTKNTRQKLKYFWEWKLLLRWNKKHSIIFKGLSVAKYCLIEERAPLKKLNLGAKILVSKSSNSSHF